MFSQETYTFGFSGYLILLFAICGAILLVESRKGRAERKEKKLALISGVLHMVLSMVVLFVLWLK